MGSRAASLSALAASLTIDGSGNVSTTGQVNAAGGTMTGSLNMQGAGFRFNNAAGVGGPYLSYDASGTGVGFLNAAGTAWNLSVNDAGNVTARGSLAAAGATLSSTLWITGSASIAMYGGRISMETPAGAVNGLIAGDVTNGLGFINAAQTQWTFYVTDAGAGVFPLARPTWAGLTPWDNGNLPSPWYSGNLNPLKMGSSNTDTAATYFRSGSPPNIAGIGTGANSPDSAQLTISNAGNQSASAVIQFHREGAFAAYFGLDTDNVWKVGGRSMGTNSYQIWHAGNFTPGNWATAGAQVQWASAVTQASSGNAYTLGAPWVMVGLAGPGNGTLNAIGVMAVWLRNQ